VTGSPFALLSALEEQGYEIGDEVDALLATPGLTMADIASAAWLRAIASATTVGEVVDALLAPIGGSDEFELDDAEANTAVTPRMMAHALKRAREYLLAGPQAVIDALGDSQDEES